MLCESQCYHEEKDREVRDNRIWLIFTATLAFVGVATGIYCHRQMRKTYRMIGSAVKNISDTTVVDIHDEMVGDYQRNLDDVGRIYQSVASAMAKTASGDGAFNLK